MYKGCELYEKKIHTIKLLYGFFEDTPEEKYQAIEIFKGYLNDLNLYIQALGILVSIEDDRCEENAILMKNYEFYASYCLGARQPSLKLSGFVLFSHLVDLDFKWAQEKILKVLGTVTSKDNWEVRMMYLIVLGKVMRRLISSEEYQKFG